MYVYRTEETTFFSFYSFSSFFLFASSFSSAYSSSFSSSSFSSFFLFFFFCFFFTEYEQIVIRHRVQGEFNADLRTDFFTSLRDFF